MLITLCCHGRLNQPPVGTQTSTPRQAQRGALGAAEGECVTGQKPTHRVRDDDDLLAGPAVQAVDGGSQRGAQVGVGNPARGVVAVVEGENLGAAETLYLPDQASVGAGGAVLVRRQVDLMGEGPVAGLAVRRLADPSVHDDDGHELATGVDGGAHARAVGVALGGQLGSQVDPRAAWVARPEGEPRRCLGSRCRSLGHGGGKEQTQR